MSPLLLLTTVCNDTLPVHNRPLLFSIPLLSSPHPTHEFFTTPTLAALNTLPFNVKPLLCV